MKTLILLLIAIIFVTSTQWETSTFKVTQEGNSANWVIQNLFDQSQVRIRIDALEETSSRKLDWQSSKEVKISTGKINITKDGSDVLVDFINYKCEPCSVKDSKEVFNFNGSIDVFLFNEGGNYTIRGQKVAIVAGAFKFNFEFNEWTFKSEKSSLTQNIFVKEEDDKKSLSYARLLTKKQKYGTFQIEYPETAIVDGKQKDIKISTSGSSPNQKFEFPYFKDYIYYDPTVYTQNSDPVPPGYSEASTKTMRVYFSPDVPDFYLLDINLEVQGFLHVAFKDLNESSGNQAADLSKQTYVLKESEETLICDGGKNNQQIMTLKYVCNNCQTSLNQRFDGIFQIYFINETQKSCNFGQQIGYKVDIQSGDVKMDVLLTQWPWKDQKNTLKLTIVTEEGTSQNLFELGTSRKKNNLNEFSASFAQETVIFNQSDPSDNKLQDAKIDTIGSQNIVEISHFDANHGIYYDPIFHKGSNASLLSLILSAFIFLL